MQRYVVARAGGYDEDLADYQLRVQATDGGSRACWKGRGRAVARIGAARLADLKNETLVIWGACDRVLRDNGRDDSAAIPRSRRLRIPDAGHAVFFDQPEAFIAALAGFLEGQSGTGLPA
jgi:pimeloyl-ACP methyl ester carboxylesterase